MRRNVRSFSDFDLDAMNLPKPDITDSDISVPGPWNAVSSMSRHKYQLPTHPRRVGTIPYIASDTFAKLITDPASNPYKHITIIDARSAEEWAAGHINGSHHAQTVDAVVPHLPGKAEPNDDAVVFYCEFSSHRGPSLAEDFRNFDRAVNYSSETGLSYPETYLLAGGFAEFFGQYPKLCYGYYLREEACAHTIRRCKSQSNVCCRDLMGVASAQQPLTPTVSARSPFEKPSSVTVLRKMRDARDRRIE
jgi:hypothetical protein